MSDSYLHIDFMSNEYAPIIFRARIGTCDLLYYGACHSCVAGDPIFADIESLFESFLPDLVLLKGILDLSFGGDYYRREQVVNKITSKPTAELIAAHAEPGFTLRKAIDTEINEVVIEEGKYRDNYIIGQIRSFACLLVDLWLFTGSRMPRRISQCSGQRQVSSPEVRSSSERSRAGREYLRRL